MVVLVNTDGFVEHPSQSVLVTVVSVGYVVVIYVGGQ